MQIQDLDDYELIRRWRDVCVEAAMCPHEGPKRFIGAYMEALEAEMARRIDVHQNTAPGAGQ